MKTTFHKGYILIVSPWLVRWIGFLMTGRMHARGAAVFPVILVRSEDEVVPWLINHERIHFRQQIETAFIGCKVLSLVETVYAMLVLKKTFAESYTWRSGEQEAYRNQHNQNYLNERKLWAQLRYLKDKKDFKVVGPGEIG